MIYLVVYVQYRASFYVIITCSVVRHPHTHYYVHKAVHAHCGMILISPCTCTQGVAFQLWVSFSTTFLAVCTFEACSRVVK